jgi:hypothetical protein
MNMKKIIPLFVFLALSAPVLAFAAEPQQPVGREGDGAVVTSLDNPVSGVTSIGQLVDKVVKFIVNLSYFVIAFFLVLSGFKFVAARGNETKLTSAKQTFWYTIVGALLIIGAQTIIAIVESIIKGIQNS